MPAFTFYASKDKLTNHGNKAGTTIEVEKINREVATLAREVRWLRHGLHCSDCTALQGVALHCPGYC
jgi:hypothetical protein